MAFTNKQKMAFEMYERGLTRAEIIKQLPVADKTMTQWFKDDEFVMEVKNRQDKYFTRTLSDQVGKCLDLYLAVRDDPNQQINLRIGAANKILEIAGKFSHAQDINITEKKIVVGIDGEEEDEETW